MHLEPTAPQDRWATNRLCKRGRHLFLVAVSVLIIVGCAEGTSRDAERGRERDAQRTSVVDDLQSTRTSEIIKGTPPSTPGATP